MSADESLEQAWQILYGDVPSATPSHGKYNSQTLLQCINFTDLVVFSADIDLPSHSSSLGQKGVNIDKLYEREDMLLYLTV